MPACAAGPTLSVSLTNGIRGQPVNRPARGRDRDRDPAPPRRTPMTMPWVLRHAVLRMLLVLVALWGLAFGLTMPFLTLTARDRGVSVGAIGVIAASFLLTQIVLQFPFGALSDRVGRIGPLAAGIALFSLATVGFVWADSAAAFIVLRAAQ